MAHSIHLGRRLGGYAERNDLVAPGLYKLVGSRNCTVCHADAGNACSSQAQCGAGQACRAQRCENVAWLTPTTPACLSCHDTAAATGHAALNTWISAEGPVETCAVCHGPGAAQAVDLVHPIGAGVLPFARLP